MADCPGSTMLAVAMSSLNALTATNWIAIVTAAIMTINLLFLTRQISIQNKISKANLMRDRFEMYWKTYNPVTKEQVEDFHMHPDDWMSKINYENYKDGDKKIKKYIAMAQLFEYLAFNFYGKKLGIKDPFGDNWLRLWTTDLTANKEFLEVKDYYRPYYPEFCDFVEKNKINAAA
jgi:hypothetical protein